MPMTGREKDGGNHWKLFWEDDLGIGEQTLVRDPQKRRGEDFPSSHAKKKVIVLRNPAAGLIEIWRNCSKKNLKGERKNPLTNVFYKEEENFVSGGIMDLPKFEEAWDLPGCSESLSSRKEGRHQTGRGQPSNGAPRVLAGKKKDANHQNGKKLTQGLSY